MPCLISNKKTVLVKYCKKDDQELVDPESIEVDKVFKDPDEVLED
jgi:hypothetical protein